LSADGATAGARWIARRALGTFLVLTVAACASGGAGRPATSGDASTATGAAGDAVGYACVDIISPQEVEQATGLQGVQPPLEIRGDDPQNVALPGQTSCAYTDAEAGTLVSIAISSGDTLAGFDTAWDSIEPDAEPIPGVGDEAIWIAEPVATAMARVKGLGLLVSISPPAQGTSTVDLKDASLKILTTIAGRL
jgi:hypothetical protein